MQDLTNNGYLQQSVINYKSQKDLKKTTTLMRTIDSLNKKLIRRHPHVFDGASKPLSAKEQTQAWDEIKAQEKNKKDIHKTLKKLIKKHFLKLMNIKI